jgi:hypothetical protein
MTIADLITQLVDHNQAIATATRGKAFEASVKEFTDALARIPDYPHAEMSKEHFDLVNRLAEQVIECIESRLYDGDDSHSLKREMAKSVYAIRKAQEELFKWRRHFG